MTSPQEIEAEVVRHTRRLERFTLVALAAVLAITLIILAGTVRTIGAIDDATGPQAQERAAETITALIHRVDCRNRAALEEAINQLLAELSDGDPPQARVRLEIPDECRTTRGG